MMTKKEKIRKFINNSITMEQLGLLYGMYRKDILYDNELVKLYFDAKNRLLKDSPPPFQIQNNMMFCKN